MKNKFYYIKIAVLSLLLYSCQESTSAAFSGKDSIPNLKPNKVQVDDMLLEKSFIKHVLPDTDVNSQAAGGYSVYGSQPWKKGIMPVVFSDTISKTKRDWFIKVAQKWTASTGITIINRTNQTEYLYVNNAESGCFSDVGAAAGQVRIMNLAEGCWAEPTTLHEIGHALGLMHEHQRADRDLFISINLNNVDPGLDYAFDLFNTMNNASSYDFYSIMHYSQYAFSKNGLPTMNTLPQYASYQKVMGIKKISAQDLKTITTMYAKVISRKK
jgi:hypothetical protein